MPDELKNKSDVSIVLILFTALAVLGVAGGGFFVHDYARARARLNWPAVEGIVLSHLDGDSGRTRYVYSFDGRSFESTRERNFMARFMKTSNADLRPGESVTVYVNPDDHAYAVLYPGGASAAFVILSLLSGFSVFFGVGGVVWALSRASETSMALANNAA